MNKWHLIQMRKFNDATTSLCIDKPQEVAELFMSVWWWIAKGVMWTALFFGVALLASVIFC